MSLIPKTRYKHHSTFEDVFVVHAYIRYSLAGGCVSPELLTIRPQNGLVFEREYGVLPLLELVHVVGDLESGLGLPVEARGHAGRV